MAAFINALHEEGTKQDCLDQVVRLWEENMVLRKEVGVQAAALTELHRELVRLSARAGAARVKKYGPIEWSDSLLDRVYAEPESPADLAIRAKDAG